MAPDRRTFLRIAAASTLSASALGTLGRTLGGASLVILENADGLLVVDATRCVGCTRCELACTEFTDGRAQPSSLSSVSSVP